jgi:NAD(P)-dependent dehydrogenase (short-subunit alcohol dehydrogenase family)
VKNVKVGGEVVTHCGWRNPDDAHVLAGKDPMFAPVLVWGGGGGLGSMAIQIVKAAGGRAVAVVSGKDEAEFALLAGKVDPCLSKVFAFDGTAECHQLMRENKHSSGNMAILVNARREGLKTLAESR